jgi:hypothetical protein
MAGRAAAIFSFTRSLKVKGERRVLTVLSCRVSRRVVSRCRPGAPGVVDGVACAKEPPLSGHDPYSVCSRPSSCLVITGGSPSLSWRRRALRVPPCRRARNAHWRGSASRSSCSFGRNGRRRGCTGHRPARLQGETLPPPCCRGSRSRWFARSLSSRWGMASWSSK